jgi:rubrerythrin
MRMSDTTYDVLTALQSKLEAVTVYDAFIEDCEAEGDGSVRQLFEQIQRDDQRHVELLRAEVERLVREDRFR